MKIHEYQAKELMREYGIPVPSGILALTADEAYEAAKSIGPCVIKAQIHSGGRGKGGGLKFAKTPEEAREIAEKMIGMNLVTKQTGAEGKIVHKVLVTEATDVKKEYYLSVTVDNANACLVIIGSGEGGTEIEEVSEKHPELIVTEKVSVYQGYHAYNGYEVARRMGIPAELTKDFVKILANMVKMTMDKDCSLIEINPLVETAEGKLLALDAKVNFDDSGLVRHPELEELRDVEEEDPKEYKASLYDLNYISLFGNIGCLVNGAGLAMATMDTINKFGGSPANFLDLGGSTTEDKVAAALEILMTDPHVEVIMINIFGGIVKCDLIASGIVSACSKLGLKVPMIVRLEGTNVDAGKKILAESGLNIIPAKDLADAAHKAVEAAKGGAK